MDVYELTPEQQKVFNKLVKAANDCEKAGIGFVNIYGTIHAYDKKKISGFSLDTVGDIPCLEHGYPPNSLNNLGGDSYADDQGCHYFNLTAKGKKILKAEQGDLN